MMGCRPRQTNDVYLSNEVCQNKQDENIPETRKNVAARIRKQQAAQKKIYDSKRKGSQCTTWSKCSMVEL